MATLTSEELDKLRRQFARWRIANGLTGKEARACMNDALQAIQDWYDANKIAGSNRIDTAAAAYGVSYTNAEKKALFQFWMEHVFLSNQA